MTDESFNDPNRGMNILISIVSQIIKLNKDEETLIRALFKVKKFNQGDYFLEEGKVCKEIGFITKGLVAYFIDSVELHVYDFCQENEFVSNYESFLNQSESSKSISCLEDTEMLCITFNDLQVLYKKISEGQKLGRIISENLFLDAIEKLTSFYTESPEAKYERFLKKYPDLIQRIPQYYVASFVNVKPQSLSRIRKRMLNKSKVNPGE
ncbi:Crp/Fnr family transcriptional regulator [Arthrospiribacter ruber]|uniref:Crp/Fnr family transcriptional regulator n=1 Tax=Arthrospiribacter ruber TaxID=2487934 RepID=A0A951MD68_9BACT|nr:cyclic nucleotide-binding domain-containing protein [Arthrospiribacter ruber]MBW3466986.1 Crp/Fnr family transcriptional regulator [Arthrospiribacter ruber]